MKRLRTLSGEQQRAGAAAIALFLTLFLPWYSHPIPSPLRGGGLVSDRVSAWQAFSFVEAAVLVVAAAVLYLLWARSERKAFHLPGGDGMAVTAAGAWVCFLLVWRLFDKPDFKPGPVGIEWGLFVALAVAVVMTAMGQRMRAEHRPEPPNPAEDPLWHVPERRRRERPDRRPVDSRAVTRTLREDRPSWEGEPPEAPSRAERPTISLPEEPPPPTTRRLGEHERSRDRSRDETRPLRDDDDERLF